MATQQPAGSGAHAAPVDFREVQKSPELQELRKRQRSFIFPMAVVFLLWYFAYVLLADYAHDFMSTQVWGNINIGLILGLANMVGGYIGARMAVKQGSKFIRIVFLVVVSALICKLGYDVWVENIRG